jgi:NHLM bacteriocin system ABC transporter ATP-binding protein
VLLTDPATVWLVEQGSADVFLVRLREGEAVGVRHHFLRVPQGASLFGAAATDDHVLLAVPTPDSRLRATPRQALLQAGEPAGVAGGIDTWITAVSRGLAGDALPRVFEVLEPGAAITVADQARVLLPRGGLVWVSVVEGSARFLGDTAMPMARDAVPVATSAWVEAAPQSRLLAETTASRIQSPALWDDVDRFMTTAIAAATRNLERARVREADRLLRRAESERQDLDRAFRRLAAASQPDATTDEAAGDPWLAACRAAGHAMGMTFDAEGHPAPLNLHDPVAAVATGLGVRSRVVALKGPWWTQDAGPMVARREADGAPVALLPVAARRYVLYDPAAGVRTPITESVAASVEPLAWCLYRPFPARPLGGMDLVRFGLQGGHRDLMTVLLMGVGAGLLGTMLPVVTGVVFDTVIPGADRQQLLVVTLLLMAAAACGAVFQLVQNFAMQRVESRMDAALEAAVWDRLLGLPVPFFRNHSSGDLAMRSLSISTMRRLVTGSVISSVLAGIFSVFSFGLLFYYSWPLALLATGLTAVTALTTAWLGYLDVRYQRDVTAASGRLSSMLLQFVNGISKLRVSATENRAFAAWAAEFSRRQRATRKGRLVGVALSVFSAIMPVLAMAVIFWATARAMGQGAGASLSTGSFLAFNAAFAQFQSAVLGLSSAVVTLLGLVPLYERARPILAAVPETDRAKGDPGELAGHIEVAHVNFRYRPDTPLVLRDVSMRIPAGRFVAIVGASGSGKSTLFRMLMGFEKPESGAIYFDQQDQAHLNVEALRRQIGVVLQSGRLLTDSLFRNIVGASKLTIEDAWAAAAMAGLEADIRAMPMGMHTLISEGGGGLSGGQRQRVMIARAIARRPRILLFDEATSALDNETQAIVTRSLASLQATRVVIAHRLSTIMHADYIYVMDKGAVVQEGTYQELIGREGTFADLARRQTA